MKCDVVQTWKMVRRSALLTSAIFLAVSLVGLAPVSSAQAASVELRVFEWEGYISLFQKEFEEYAKAQGKDIKLIFSKDSSGKARYITSADDIFLALRNDEADVVTPTHNYYKGENGKLIALLMPIDTAKLKNYADVYPKLRSASFFENGGKVFGVPMLGGSYALAYNSAKASEPTSWTELLDAKAKGTFSITSDQYEANVYQMALLAGVKPVDVYDYDKYTEEQRKATQENLNKLVANASGFWGGMPYPKDMASLSYVTDYWFGVAAANKEGQSWKFAKPKEGVTVWCDTVAVAKKLEGDAAKAEAAHMLLDYVVSKEAQTKVYEAFGSVIVNGKAREAMPADKQAVLPGEAFFAEEYFWKPLTPRTRNGFKAMWETAKKAAGK